jgi:hypothetical protein
MPIKSSGLGWEECRIKALHGRTHRLAASFDVDFAGIARLHEQYRGHRAHTV